MDFNELFVKIFDVIDSVDDSKSCFLSILNCFSNSSPLNVIIDGISFEIPRFSNLNQCLSFEVIRTIFCFYVKICHLVVDL